jgi:hypothetical protein
VQKHIKSIFQKLGSTRDHRRPSSCTRRPCS